MKKLLGLFLLTFTLGAMAMEEGLIITGNNNDGNNVMGDGSKAPNELITAVKNSDVGTVKEILTKSGVDVNGTDEYNCDPLIYAAHSGHLEIIKLLLKRGADVNCKKNINRSALHVAATRGDSDVVTLLLEYGANVNVTRTSGDTPLHNAISTAQFTTAQILSDYGASALAQNNWAQSSAHLLAYMINMPGAETLLLNMLRNAYQQGTIDKLFAAIDHGGRTFLDILSDSEFKTVLVGAAKNPNAWMALSLQEDFKQEKKRVVRSGRTAEFLRNREHNIKK